MAKPPTKLLLLKNRLKDLGVQCTVGMTQAEARTAWTQAKFTLQNKVTFILVHIHTAYKHTHLSNIHISVVVVYLCLDCNVLSQVIQTWDTENQNLLQFNAAGFPSNSFITTHADVTICHNSGCPSREVWRSLTHLSIQTPFQESQIRPDVIGGVT